MARAKALDLEIQQAKNLPDDSRPAAIQDLAVRVRQQPVDFLGALAFNLAASTSEADGRVTLQAVADTLADAISRSPARDQTDELYRTLVEVVSYGHATTSLEDARYRAALGQLEVTNKRRKEADFALMDLHNQSWSLKRLRGKIVLVNFWATWCPPCRQEIGDLGELHRRFHGRGLVILSITDEEPATVRKFLAEHPVTYQILLDPGHKVKDLFVVHGIPKSFLYDRQGHLTEQTLDRPTLSGWLQHLKKTGLRIN